ncbi:MAG: glycosyltransferase [Desulfobacterales bacterium]|jgi:glycosyltransferase involved in cell wall biosynthesis
MATDRPKSTLAVFLATSGHSGVDRVMGNLIPEMAGRGVSIDLLQIRGHGPYMDPLPAGVRRIDLGSTHVNSSLPALVRYLREEKPRVILSDKDRVNRTVLAAAAISGIPCRTVIRVGTTVSKNLDGRRWWHRRAQLISIRHLYARADAIIVPSMGAAEDLGRIGRLDPKKIHVAPSPVVGPRIFQLAREPTTLPWPDRPSVPLVLGVGELCRRKDFSTLMRAFARVREGRECRLAILGRGRLRDRLLQLACELKIHHDVWLPGFVDNPYAVMARANLFVLSSRCEGAPVALMEALALGTPIISTDCPSGPSEILASGRFGRLVPVGDPKAMAAAMDRALDAPPDVQALVRGADRYQVAACTDRYLDILAPGVPVWPSASGERDR